MSQSVTYTFYAEVGGEPATGLTPTFSVFREVVSGSNLLNSNLPTISSLGDGFYKYSFTWPDVSIPGNLPLSYLVKIDLGVSVPSGERYIINRIERHDYLPAIVGSIQESAEAIKVKADSLIDSAELLEALVTRLLDIEEGNWEISNNRLIIKDSGGVKITEFNLFGSSGQPTSSNPYKRELTYQKPRPTL